MNPDMLENITLADAYDTVLEELRNMENELNNLKNFLQELIAIAREVPISYHAYRARGLIPAPEQYQNMVSGILNLEKIIETFETQRSWRKNAKRTPQGGGGRMLKPKWIKPSDFIAGDLVFIGANCDSYEIIEVTDTSFVMIHYHYGEQVGRLTEPKGYFSPISFMVARGDDYLGQN